MRSSPLSHCVHTHLIEAPLVVRSLTVACDLKNITEEKNDECDDPWNETSHEEKILHMKTLDNARKNIFGRSDPRSLLG